jgi:hypothetical protein
VRVSPSMRIRNVTSGNSFEITSLSPTTRRAFPSGCYTADALDCGNHANLQAAAPRWRKSLEICMCSGVSDR